MNISMRMVQFRKTHRFLKPLATARSSILSLASKVSPGYSCRSDIGIITYISTGPAQDLDSPKKSNQQPRHDPEAQEYRMPSTPSTKPTLQQFRNPSFTTPRMSIDTGFSSGPDQSSPANADAEDTPDPPERSNLLKNKSAMVEFIAPKSDNRGPSQGLFGKSGRGEISRRPYNEAVVRRVEKRRRRDVDKDVRLAPRHSSHDSDYEEHPSSSEDSRQRPPKAQSMGLIPSILTFIDAHPGLPNTLSFYVQFLLNCFFAFCMMYVLYGVYSTIKNDIDERAMMESSEIFAEMTACTHEYKENRCDRATRVPAMEVVCNNWEKCMQRDPLKVGRSRLSAVMFAQIFNGFIEPISLKAIVRNAIMTWMDSSTNY